MRLIVPMGGRGTRLRPFSHTTPKPLLPLLGRPAIAHILDAFASALGRPVDEVVFVTGPDVGEGARHALRAACEAMLEEGPTGAGGEYQLTDAYDRLVQSGTRTATAPAARWLDTGTLESYRRTVRALLDAGEHGPTAEPADCVVLAPSYVHPDASVHRSVIGPYVAVEAGAVIEDAAIRESVVMADATVRESSLGGALVGPRAVVSGAVGGPTLGDDARLEL